MPLHPLMADILRGHGLPQRKPVSRPFGARQVSVPLEWEDQILVVDGYLLPALPASGPRYDCAGEPAEPAEFYPVGVTDELGTDRPELLAVADEHLDLLTAEAEDLLRDWCEAEDENAADAARETRWER